MSSIMSYETFKSLYLHYQQTRQPEKLARLCQEFGPSHLAQFQREEREEKEKAEARVKELASKEAEVHTILQKNPDDLTGRDISRLKELSNDPDIDMDAILTRKELSILSEIINDTPKEKNSRIYGEK